jgi:hypothetical protein
MILNYSKWSQLNEQDEATKGTVQVQKFLNAKKITGKDGKPLVVDGMTGPNSNTEAAIQKYQQRIGVWPTDGVWGYDTMEKMPEQDRELWDSFSSWF